MTSALPQVAAEPAAAVPPILPAPNRPRGPHPEETRLEVRDLVTLTTLSHREIGRRTGVHATTVSRLAPLQGWDRPERAQAREDITPEGRRRLRRSAIAERLLDQAEALLFQT